MQMKRNTAPCVRNCCLDEHDICLGCGRSLEQILNWSEVDQAQRQLWLDEAAERRQKRRLSI
ncbi:DUF1289 domain-containing protein [Pontibacterium granulatum]|uniref:DUF1289 domain-containing protein n=1 Tax=Pontibacterium granulatum TaxID=2036029 RepID=UPI00249B092D|nr:DUF1289 domain-containing protein [Pontibacterium granulatum]MDI3323161.1 DUF1289 domain-containing protein [Pontibacterium granulatum]